MRLRNLAALAAVHVALGGCAETTQRGQRIVSAAERPPIEELCEGRGCLADYYMFSSEAFGTGELAEYYISSEEEEKLFWSLNQKHCRYHPPKIAKHICPRGIHVTYGRGAEDVKNRREAYKEFVAGWLATYPSEKEAYLAIAAAALDRAWERYCNDIPLRALDAARVGETQTRTWDGKNPPDAPDVAYHPFGLGLDISPSAPVERERLARRIERSRIASGYENAGESLLTVMSCEGSER